MPTSTESTTVSRTIVVRAPIEHTFRTFTERMSDWWDPDHHLVDGFERMEVDLRVGGRIVDHGRDGATCSWSRVLVYDPPHHFAFSWEITPDFRIETDPARASEVHVRFIAEGDAATRVELAHVHLDRHGDDWQAMRNAVDAGWDLSRFAQFAETAAP